MLRCKDVLPQICNYLGDRDKLRLLSTSRQMWECICHITLVNLVYVSKISRLSYFDRFSRVITCNERQKIPTNAKEIHQRTSYPRCIINSVTHLQIMCIPRNQYVIPPSVTHLMVDTIYDILPGLAIHCHTTVTHLTFGHNYNSFMKNMPLSITHLKFGNRFNRFIVGKIKPMVTYLEFGRDFNQSIIDAIPGSVTQLMFGDSFDQPIIGAIPKSVTHLVFGDSFNQPIIGAIPKSVTHLVFGNSFNQSILGAIPDSVIHLAFGNSFDQLVPGAMPSSVTCLKLGSRFNKRVVHVPLTVTSLWIGGRVATFTNNISYHSFYPYSNDTWVSRPKSVSFVLSIVPTTCNLIVQYCVNLLRYIGWYV